MLNIWRRKALLGIITLTIKNKKPANNLNSIYSIKSLLSIALTPSYTYLNFIGGRRAFITIELNSIPRKLVNISIKFFLVLIVKLSLLYKLLKLLLY